MCLSYQQTFLFLFDKNTSCWSWYYQAALLVSAVSHKRIFQGDFQHLPKRTCYVHNVTLQTSTSKTFPKKKPLRSNLVNRQCLNSLLQNNAVVFFRSFSASNRRDHSSTISIKPIVITRLSKLNAWEKDGANLL